MEDISNQTIEKVYNETKEFLTARNTGFTETLSDFYLPYFAEYESSSIKRKIENGVNSYLKEHHLKINLPRFSIRTCNIIDRDDEEPAKNVIFTIPTNIEYRVGVGTSEITSKRKQFSILFNNSGVVLERDYFENFYGYDAFVCDGNPSSGSFNVWIKSDEKYFAILRRNAERLKTTLEKVTVSEIPKGVKKVTVKNEYENLISFDLDFNTNKDDNLLCLNLKCTLTNKNHSKTYYIKILGGRLQAYYFIDDIKVNLLENPNEIKRFYDDAIRALDKASITKEASYDLFILKRILAYFFECAAKHKILLSASELKVKEVSAVQKCVIEHVKNLESAIPVPYFREKIQETVDKYTKKNNSPQITFYQRED